LLGALGLGAAWCGPGLAPHWPALARAMAVPTQAPGTGGVSVTFDDGPHPEGTPAVLEALARGRAAATFFVVGEQVERFPALAREIVAAGHELSVHGYRHRNQMRLLPGEFADDLRRGIDVIGSVAGIAPRLYRPPYGIFTLTGLLEVRRTLLQPVLWSKWGRDWRARTTPVEIARLASDGVAAGDVLLLHDADWYSSTGSHRNTARAVPWILDALAQRELPTVKL
jgi:peptidoglycan-N-acetylglucosamine deacetylase